MRTKTVKKASRVIIEKYYGRLTTDFDTNKRVCEEIAVIQTKRLRNKIAGFTTVSTSEHSLASIAGRSRSAAATRVISCGCSQRSRYQYWLWGQGSSAGGAFVRISEHRVLWGSGKAACTAACAEDASGRRQPQHALDQQNRTSQALQHALWAG